MKWIALFSQTGTEILKLTSIATPDLIITNNMDYNGPLENVVKIKKANDVYKYLIEVTKNEDKDSVVITLHGWLRIIPGDVIAQLPTIYNGHPAPIFIYPELKGLDPQIRLFEGIKEGKYKYIGSVVHEVAEAVDEGEIVYTNAVELKDSERSTMEFKQLDTRLRNLSYETWREFLEVIVNGR